MGGERESFFFLAAGNKTAGPLNYCFLLLDISFRLQIFLHSIRWESLIHCFNRNCV